jgi:UMF1 family MFS transporter
MRYELDLPFLFLSFPPPRMVVPSLTRLSPIVSKARQEFETNLEQYRSLRQQELLRGRQEQQDDSDDGQVIFSTSSSSSSSFSLLMSTAASRYNSIKSSQTSKISSRGIAFGYAAGITTLVLLLPIMNSLNQSGEEGEGSLGFDQTWPLRVAIGFSAVVWLSGSLSECSQMCIKSTRRERLMFA